MSTVDNSGQGVGFQTHRRRCLGRLNHLQTCAATRKSSRSVVEHGKDYRSQLPLNAKCDVLASILEHWRQPLFPSHQNWFRQ